jgi:hypothetical protein
MLKGHSPGNGHFLTILDGARHILASDFRPISDKLLKYRTMIARSQSGMRFALLACVEFIPLRDMKEKRLDKESWHV